MTLSSHQRTYWLLMLPALLLLAAFCLFPLSRILWLSVTVPEAGLQNYQDLLTRPLVHRIWLTTLRICAITTVISVVLGYVVAYAMTTVQRDQRSLMMFCVLITFWLSVLVRTFAWVMLLRGEGLVNQTLIALGIVSSPLALVRNEFGVIVGMVHVLLPYAILPIYSHMLGMDRRVVDAARSLGATPIRTFLLVFLPLSKPGVIAATLLVFIFSLGFYITPALLGGGRVVMITEYIRVGFEDTLQWGMAATLSASLLIAVFLMLALAGRFIDLRTVFGAK